jgi:uncharacterized protein YkwD
MKKNYLYLLAIILVIILFTSCSKDNTVEPTPEFPHISYDLLLSEINFARTQPAEYAKLIEEMLPYYSDYNGQEGILLTYPGEEISWLLQEGKVAAIEAIEALKNQGAVLPLTLLTGLNKASQRLCDIQGPTGQVGHTAPDGSTHSQRVAMFCKPEGNAVDGENIAYGIDIARRIVIQLIIDDGVPDRGHRINIYNPAWTHIGFGWGYHKQYKVMCAMNFAYGYINQ